METSRLRYYKKMYFSAVLFNALVAATFLLAFEPLYTLIGGGHVPQIPLLQLFILLMGIAIGLFGVVYYLAGRRFEYRDSSPLIATGVAGKLIFFFVVLCYTLRQDIPWGMMGIAIVDLLYSALFIESLIYKAKYHHQPESSLT